MKRIRKYGWPEDLDLIPELDDETLKKIRQYAPTVRSEQDYKADMAVLNELMSRGLL